MPPFTIYALLMISKFIKSNLHFNLLVVLGLLVASPTVISHASHTLKGFFSLRSDEAKFFYDLGAKESNGHYGRVNKFGYLGKYQFGEVALSSLGYYLHDGSAKNDWRGEWIGKHGISSKEDFLQNKFVQEVAVRELAAMHWKAAIGYGLHKFIGKKVHGVLITKEGLIAAMHLSGPRRVYDFITYGTNTSDRFGTTVKKYMHAFSRCDS
jgi:hypothetical protein